VGADFDKIFLSLAASSVDSMSEQKALHEFLLACRVEKVCLKLSQDSSVLTALASLKRVLEFLRSSPRLGFHHCSFLPHFCLLLEHATLHAFVKI